ncbi:MAG TPA: hypothetical protein VFT59_04045 [Candidatus Saccharimonadales bacterium]|nr:hypothetical protein [Candidatus Saccharimonadales bacterium]
MLNNTYMQRMAVCGLFMTVWSSMVRSESYYAAIRECATQQKEAMVYAYDGTLASWRTIIAPAMVGLKVVLRHHEFGGWNFSIVPDSFGVFELDWLPEGELARKDEAMVFDDNTFEQMFATLKRACGLYVKHNRLTVNRDNHPLLDGFFDS